MLASGCGTLAHMQRQLRSCCQCDLPQSTACRVRRRVTQDALRDPEVERRSKAEYPQLADEIARALPEFDEVYGTVRGYDEGMGWVSAGSAPAD